MGAVSAASLASYFLQRRDSVALCTYGTKLSYLPPDTGDKQYFKILSALCRASSKGRMPLQKLLQTLFQEDFQEALQYSSFLHVKEMEPSLLR